MFIFYIVSFASTGQGLKLRIVDHNLQPLSDAVIEILSSQASQLPSPKNGIYVMDQVNKTFLPNVLLVPKNSAVSFPNSDNIRHHVYSFSKPKVFELKLYAGKPKSPISFDQSGVVVLGCNIHDEMVGYIYVSEFGNAYKSDVQGLISLDESWDDLTKLTLWHPYQKAGVGQVITITKEQIQRIDGELGVVIETIPPAPRDSFEDVFSNVH
ncbi:methylamine utilization protein [Thalassotalea sp. G2M2-11]|uniref:methylamine utilization protein n=1 Tax=Thalassotalea sp. G2M2-11 TaxID=2787627 RepID=UPI0032179A42